MFTSNNKRDDWLPLSTMVPYLSNEIIRGASSFCPLECLHVQTRQKRRNVKTKLASISIDGASRVMGATPAARLWPVGGPAKMNTPVRQDTQRRLLAIESVASVPTWFQRSARSKPAARRCHKGAFEASQPLGEDWIQPM